ncbi:MAG: hypothetical protein HUU08_16375, partial [Candidatus Brocadia sp.]|nr:hypothetical protein [Candidatus Brocadia sp.]
VGKGQGDAHPTPYGKARLAATILYDIPSYAVRLFFYKKLRIHPYLPAEGQGQIFIIQQRMAPSALQSLSEIL